ncbi:MAG: 3-hydroxyacyl-CoA dehydrogenase NAD-binding domain-containing protein [Candidatus Promineifilaceae bacterium]|nr:3-hydroxyacyl-CoA dehydrogenase NAD-binding domain-containing protein [Candidatus Promineifilaceae bacterium]
MTINYNKDTENIVTLTIDIPGRPVNVINEEFSAALRQHLDQLEEDSALRGVIIASAKETFVAGGDLEWLVKLTDPEMAFIAAQELKSDLRRLEKLGKPVVAAVNGSALGGGLELALACHHRIVVDNKRIKIGFPEVTLGLLPGGGGVIRLTRLLGLQAAFPYLMEGLQINPQQAQKAGIVNELANSQDDLWQRARAWILSDPGSFQPWDAPRYRMPGGNPTNPRVAQILAVAPAMLKKRTYGNYPAPQAIMNTAVEGALVDFDTATRIESRYFAQVACGQVAKNMINAFWFQLNQINAGKSRPSGLPPAEFRKVGVLGAGMMGHGIAYISAYAGMDVVLKDLSQEKAAAGKELIAGIIKKRVSTGKMSTEQGEQILARILPTGDPGDLQGCDLVIEAVFENRELKSKVTAEAEAQLDETAVFASNTSTLPITSLAENASRPEKFIGLHFFSPVHKMKLVEIISGAQTSQKTLAAAFDYVRKIRKIPIVVSDSRGFYTSRVFATYLKEGLALLSEGQNPRAIESAGLQAGMPVGPLALADEVSLSLMVHINEQTQKDLLAEGRKLPSHPADKVLNTMTRSLNRMGKARGAGFYEYPEDRPKFLWPGLKSYFPQNGQQLSQKEMIERLMFIQALETARCYAEQVVTSTADANIGSIFGWGFAPFKGGTLQYINDYGVAAFVARAKELAAKYGSRFDPPRLLTKMAQEKQTF